MRDEAQKKELGKWVVVAIICVIGASLGGIPGVICAAAGVVAGVRFGNIAPKVDRWTST